MKKLIYIVLFVTSIGSYAQLDNTWKQIPQESIFVHTNNTFFTTGDYLNYKIYCRKESNGFSDFSKIAYIELINQNHASLVKQKVKLNNGIGQGDFFIDPKIPSGNYKLVAYTHWMLNKKNNFFEQDVTIVNPYNSDQSSILAANDSIYLNSDFGQHKALHTSNQSLFQMSSKQATTRAKVALSFQGLPDDVKNGNYSIVVQKIDSFSIPKKNNILQANMNSGELEDQLKYIPELRGELIEGIVTDSLNNPAQFINVGVSLPGNDFIFKLVTTNTNGKFYVNLNDIYETDHAIFQVIHKDRAQYNINIIKDRPVTFSGLNFSDFRMTKSMKQALLKRSVANQIENAYSASKPNTSDSILPNPPFYLGNSKRYNLDDYTRFPTVKETIIEILPTVFVRQRKGASTVHVRIYDQQEPSRLLPLILIDGVQIQDHEEFLALNPNHIQYVDIANISYIYGTKVYDGILAIETKDQYYKTKAYGSFIKEVDLFKPLLNKTYYKQTYSNSTFDRIPDYRYQLLWQPQLDLSQESIEFFTSDIKGHFQIQIQGFTANGEPVNAVDYITVE